MSFTCEKCDAEFKAKGDYNRHLNKKIPCGKEERVQYKITKRTCLYCEVLYADVQSVGKHMKICPLRPSETDELKQIIAQLSNKMDNMSQQMEKMQPTTINNNIQNINNIQNNNIVIVPFGKEDLSFLTLKDFSRVLRKGCYSIPELLKLIHCNDDRPEFMNVYIKNFKDEYMFTFDGKDWGVEKKDDVLANMIENKKNFLESKMNDMSEELPKYAITMFQKFLERSDNDEVIANIKDELKNMFYKNRKHVTKNPKQITNTITSMPVKVNEVEGKKPKKKVLK
jgi:uncharacterized C2H2 Zn-finger protein